jgi:hypothetical protein
MLLTSIPAIAPAIPAWRFGLIFCWLLTFEASIFATTGEKTADRLISLALLNFDSGLCVFPAEDPREILKFWPSDDAKASDIIA